jgi:phosphopantothenoylcysteine decarboxylase/phosphopantothenate--cysteine ligase
LVFDVHRWVAGLTYSQSTLSQSLAGKTIVLGVTGSIAAYKAVVLARLLVQAGAKVHAVLTAGAERFVGAVTFSGITGNAVSRDMWDPAFQGEKHVELASRADLVIVAPTTADAIARFAQGRADDLLGAVHLCAKCPVLMAPAMHPHMWSHPAVQANVAALRSHGRITLVGPVDGVVASGESGLGRMAEPEAIVAAAEALLAPRKALGLRVLVTAGPTQEAIDPVRYLGNRSSGTMGFAIARAFADAGADVQLIAGPVSHETPPGVARTNVESARQMFDAVHGALGAGLEGADVVIMAAAVADFRPETAAAHKIKKTDDAAAPVVALVKNPDILASLGAARSKATPLLVGFALETGTDAEVLSYAAAKLARKRVDMVVANAAVDALGGADTRAFFVDAHGHTGGAAQSKSALAAELVKWVLEHRPSTGAP